MQSATRAAAALRVRACPCLEMHRASSRRAAAGRMCPGSSNEIVSLQKEMFKVGRCEEYT